MDECPVKADALAYEDQEGFHEGAALIDKTINVIKNFEEVADF